MDTGALKRKGSAISVYTFVEIHLSACKLKQIYATDFDLPVIKSRSIIRSGVAC